MTKTYEKVIGHCPVDSGQIILIDPCYLKDWKDGDFLPEKSRIQNHYDAACRITCGIEQAGEVLVAGLGGNGVVAASGYGDGHYPVIATYQDDDGDVRIQEITIKFIQDNV